MRMRRRPIRGEKLTTSDGMAVTVVADRGSMVEVILPIGKLWAIPKKDLNLEIIDTSAYEKMG